MIDWRDKKTDIWPDIQAQMAASAQEPSIGFDACAALCCLTYKSELPYLRTGLPPGWKFLALSPQTKGYDAAALLHTASRTLVIINRGTEFSKSVPDLLQNVVAILAGEDYGQFDAAVDFLVKIWGQQSANADEILLIGHSLGAGLAECQAALARSALLQANLPSPTRLRGFGVGSAGYARAVEDYAAEKNLSIDPDIKKEVTHLIREMDVTETIGLGDRLGNEAYIGSIFQPTMEQSPNKSGGWIWAPMADSIHNHEPFLYFKYRNLPYRRHLMWRWLKTGTYDERDGKAPPPYSSGQVPKQDR